MLLSMFLRSKFNVSKIVDTSYMRCRIYDAVYCEYQNGRHLVISACPGTVMYIEKKAPHLIEHLSRVKSPQQMAFQFVKGSRTVSVMPCYDKKLENGRDGTNFDHVLTTKDFHKVLDGLGFNEFVGTHCRCNSMGPDMMKGMSVDVWELTQWNIGSSSGGYVEFIASKVGAVSVSERRTGVKEYTSASGEVLLQTTGLENAVNYFRSSKAKGPMYNLVEIFLCKNSCIGGPGQVRVNDVNMDIGTYDDVGKEELNVLYPPMEAEKREFREIKRKKVEFKVEW